MPTFVCCPNSACRNCSPVADELLGKSGRCKRCGQTFTLTAEADKESIRIGPSSKDGETAIPMPGTVGRFELRERLGAGAFGTVYRAYDPQLDRDIALKVPNAGVVDNPRKVERFLREARAAAQLCHPHIVPVFEAGTDGDCYYIASAFIKGRTLAQAIEEVSKDERRAARIVGQLAEAVGYAHEQGIVHRDIKPANVMLDEHDDIHLMDFGLASRLEFASKLTNDGALLGTPSYMAPEQAAGQQGEAQPACDQYALGVVLYELLTGHTPFEGRPQVVLYQIVHAEPASPRSRRPDISPGLEAICLRAMAKRVEDRYPNCQALADDLQRWLQGEQITLVPVIPRTGSPNKVIPKRPVLWMCAGAALVGLLCLGLWLAVGGSDKGNVSPPVEPIVPPFALDPIQPQGVEAGKEKSFALRVRRGERRGPVTLYSRGLPAGVTFAATPLADGSEEGTIRVTIPADRAAGVLPFEVEARIGEDSAIAKVELAVTRPPSLVLSLANSLDIVAGTTRQVPVLLGRRDCEGEVRLQIVDPVEGLEGGPVTVRATSDAVDLPLSVSRAKVPGTYPVRIQAELVGTKVTTARTMQLTVKGAPSISLVLAKNREVDAGGTIRVPVRIDRRHCQGDVRVELLSLPKEITADPVVIPAKADSIDMVLVVGKEALPRTYPVKVLASLGDVTATSPFGIEVRPAKKKGFSVKRFPEMGKKVVVTMMRKQTSTRTGVGGNPKPVTTIDIVDLEYTWIVLETVGDRPIRFERYYTKAQRSLPNGKFGDLTFSRTKVSFELGNDEKWTATARGKTDPQDMELLAVLTNRETTYWRFLPEKQVEQGKNWTIEQTLIQKAFAEGSSVKLEKVTQSKGTMKKIDTKADGTPLAVMDYAMKGLVRQETDIVYSPSGVVDVVWTLETAVDGSTTEGKLNVNAKFDGTSATVQGRKQKYKVSSRIEYEATRSAEKVR